MKRREPTPDEGAADWVVSFGDMMSLLLTFFIMLFAMSTIDAEKWQEIVQSFRNRAGVNIHSSQSSFEPIKKPPSNSRRKSDMINAIVERGRDIPLIKDKDAEDELGVDIPPDLTVEEILKQGFGDLYHALLEAIKEGGILDDIELIRSETEIILRFKNRILFDSGKAELEPDVLEILYEMFEIVAQYESIIGKLIIEGNTDNVPINTARYRDNFELSIYRALNVFYFVQQQDLFPAKLIEITGYGENNPIDTNDTEEGRAKNRRTDIVIIREVSE